MTIHGRENLTATIAVAALALFVGLFISVDGTFDYKDALTKSIIFLEAQRSGKLPPNHRPAWREDSGLQDGKLMSVDLVGGYYDAGDNVKYGFPMSFTVTTLAWNAIFYKSELQAAGELGNAEAGIRWGTDFFLKAAAKKNKLYVQVGDPVLDHQCWVRPEIMETPRTVLMIDENTPGTEIAAETSAAMASASMVFRATDKAYSRRLLNKAKLLFQFAKDHKGTYDGECPFYCSFSGYNVTDTSHLSENADGCLGWLTLCNHDGNICAGRASVGCDMAVHGDKKTGVLGQNPEGRSYMAGFGQNPPVQPHHRGASVPRNAAHSLISCPLSFVFWYNKDVPNPNELTGAIVGGPDKTDNFNDKRWLSSMTEPCTYVNSMVVGPLAKLAAGGAISASWLNWLLCVEGLNWFVLCL